MGSSRENCFVFPLSLKMAAPVSALPYGLCERMRAALTRFPLSKWQPGRSKGLVWRLQEQETINWVGRERDGAVLGMPAQKQGFPINPSIYGPLTDLPDWSFADGRPAPPMKRQLQRKEKNEELARRVVQLSAEIDHGMEKWKAKQRQEEEMEKEKQVNRLQPKGNICFRTSK